MSKPVVVLGLPVPEHQLERITAVATPRAVSPASRAELLAALADAEGWLGSAVFPIDNEFLDAAPKLRVSSNVGVGYNNVDVDEMTRRGIAVCNTPGVLSDCVADLTLLLILAAAKRFDENQAYVRNGDWGRKALPPLGFDIEGKTLGLIGYGRIGQAVAKRARAFGMSIIYHDIITTNEPDHPVPQMPLRVLLRQADVVSLHVNLTNETYHLIGAEELAMMKDTAWLVNTARGPVVDQAALVDALERGVIAGAALDVIETEPPSPDDPILKAPNTILLPHIGSATVETRAAMMELAVTNLTSVLTRQPPGACVNPDVLTETAAFRP